MLNQQQLLEMQRTLMNLTHRKMLLRDLATIKTKVNFAGLLKLHHLLLHTLQRLEQV